MRNIGKILGRAAAKSKGRVDAPMNPPNRGAVLKVMKNRALQGSGGSYLQGSTPNLQGFNSGATRRLQ